MRPGGWNAAVLTKAGPGLDRPALKALPVSRYEVARYHQARVNIDHHIAIEDHFYSVPQALVHQQVEVRATARSMEILHRRQRIAAHERAFTRFAYTTLLEHVPAARRAHLEWSPGRLIRWGEPHGGACAEVIRRILASRPHPKQGYRACLGLPLGQQLASASSVPHCRRVAGLLKHENRS